jgi:hypothetical protein
MGDGVGDLAFWTAIGAIGVSFWMAMTPLIKAFARRIEGKHLVEDERMLALEARLEALEHRGMTSGEVEVQFARLADVEERLDFAERLLTNHDAARPENTP